MRQRISVLFNEPKLLKPARAVDRGHRRWRISVLFNEPKLLKVLGLCSFFAVASHFSALQRAEIAEIVADRIHIDQQLNFSALQRAEIAETQERSSKAGGGVNFSALQRAEIAEMIVNRVGIPHVPHFSALQRAEIAETYDCVAVRRRHHRISVLFNEPKLLKRAGF